MNNTPDQWRMYGLVPYNISPIQQGIQFGHAVQEYNNMMMRPKYPTKVKDAFDHWRLYDKTFIILNGGTTSTRILNTFDTEPPLFAGTLNNHLVTLNDMKVVCKAFYEPDLGDQLTAVVFLVPDKVYKKDEYPDFDTWLRNTINDTETYLRVMLQNGQDEAGMYKRYRREWTDLVGGKQNVELREFLKQFKKA